MQMIVLDDGGRLGLIDLVLGMLRASGDERAPGAIVEYERQRAEVAARMGSQSEVQSPKSRVRSPESEVQSPESEVGGRPVAQVVGMQTVELRGNAPS